MVDGSLNGQRFCEELSLLISLYRKPARLVDRTLYIGVMKTSSREKKSLFTDGPKNGARSLKSISNFDLQLNKRLSIFIV